MQGGLQESEKYTTRKRKKGGGGYGKDHERSVKGKGWKIC